IADPKGTRGNLSTSDELHIPRLRRNVSRLPGAARKCVSENTRNQSARSINEKRVGNHVDISAIARAKNARGNLRAGGYCQIAGLHENVSPVDDHSVQQLS